MLVLPSLLGDKVGLCNRDPKRDTWQGGRGRAAYTLLCEDDQEMPRMEWYFLCFYEACYTFSFHAFQRFEPLWK
jgi:hypothetical protein